MCEPHRSLLRPSGANSLRCMESHGLRHGLHSYAPPGLLRSYGCPTARAVGYILTPSGAGCGLLQHPFLPGVVEHAAGLDDREHVAEGLEVVALVACLIEDEA